MSEAVLHLMRVTQGQVTAISMHVYHVIPEKSMHGPSAVYMHTAALHCIALPTTSCTAAYHPGLCPAALYPPPSSQTTPHNSQALNLFHELITSYLIPFATPCPQTPPALLSLSLSLATPPHSMLFPSIPYHHFAK